MAAEHPATHAWSGSTQLKAPLLWMGTATTTNGLWSINYSSAGFSSAPFVQAIAIISSSNVYDKAFAGLDTAPGINSASGYAVRGANLTLLGSTVRNVPDGTVIQVIAIGETYS